MSVQFGVCSIWCLFNLRLVQFGTCSALHMPSGGHLQGSAGLAGLDRDRYIGDHSDEADHPQCSEQRKETGRAGVKNKEKSMK